MKGFSSGDGCMRVDLLERLGKGVEQRPCCAGPELLMLGFAPMGQNLGDLAGGYGSAVRGLYDKVMGTCVGEAHVAVGFDAFIQLHEMGAKLTDSPCRQLPQVPDSEPCVFPADLDESSKRQIVTNEDPCASHEASGKGLVMTVSQAHHPAVSILRHVAELGHFEDAEVSVAIVADGVGLTEQVEARINELIFHLHDKMPVGEWEPGVGCRWCPDAKERIPLDDLSSAM